MEEQTHQSVIPHRTFWRTAGELRLVWKLLCFFGIFLSSMTGLMIAALFLPLNAANPQIATGIEFLSVTIATSTCVLFLEKRNFATVGLHLDKSALRLFALGMVIAGAMMATVCGIEVVSGVAVFRPATVSFLHGAGIIGDGIVLFLLVGASEELLTRGFPMQTIARKHGSFAGVLSIAALFAGIHATNPNATWLAILNVYLAGIWLGVAYFVSGSLWLPIGLHAGWNFMQSSVLGFPVSGIVERGLAVATCNDPAWISGGGFGPEGGCIVTIILLVGTGLLVHPRIAAHLRFRDQQSATERDERVLSERAS